MTQSLKCLPCKQEDLNLTPRTHMNALNVVACAVTVILAGKVDMGESLGFTVHSLT